MAGIFGIFDKGVGDVRRGKQSGRRFRRFLTRTHE